MPIGRNTHAGHGSSTITRHPGARTRRRIGAIALAASLVLGACSDDDDDTAAVTVEITDPADTTAPVTDPPTTISTSTTTTSPTAVTLAPTTTVDVEALKAQIAADFVASEQAREDLNRNPSLDGLDARVARIAVPGSPSYDSLLAFVRGMVERGERVVSGEPDYSKTLVEDVVVIDPTHATITTCTITNAARIGPDGVPLDGSGRLYAARRRQLVELTASNWLPTAQPEGLWIQDGMTSCAP